MSNIRKLTGIVVFAGALALAGFWASKKSHIGPENLDFHLADFEGKMHDFELERSGKAVFVHYWASWCPPCLTELPEFNEFIRKHEKNTDYDFWLVSVDDSSEAALSVLKKYTWPTRVKLLFDPNREAPKKWGTFDYPETYLLRLPDLKRTKWIGNRNWNDPKYVEEIKKFLNL